MKFPILSTSVIYYLVSALWMTMDLKEEKPTLPKRKSDEVSFFLALNHAYIPQMKMYRTC